MKKFKNLLFVLMFVATAFLLSGCTEIDDSTESSTENKKANLKLDEKFEFDELEIIIGSDMSFDKVNNEYSDKHGKTVIKIPVTVKNMKDETHSLNMFYYKMFGSQGTELDDASSYFDEALDTAGDLRPGASYTKYLYYVYDGDGTYVMEFDDWSNKKSLEFKVEKK